MPFAQVSKLALPNTASPASFLPLKRIPCKSKFAESSVRNPPFVADLDLELELLQQKSGIEIWNVECKDFPNGLDCGMGFYFSERRIVEWE